jgi:cation diffusion facilitator family transporter
MKDTGSSAVPTAHRHVFLGEGHATAERRTWAVIALCGSMMVLEIVGGLFFGSIALVADGMHMSTHAGALLLAALAYSYSRKHADDARFTFGTGKLGDLAGFTSAVVLAMIALLIGYESISRLFSPVPIAFREAIPIACLGLLVNIGSVWLLSGGGHHHGHSHGSPGHHDHDEHGEEHTVLTGLGSLVLSIFEVGIPPVFRLRSVEGVTLGVDAVQIETVRPDGGRQIFAMENRGSYLESLENIPEPHAFTANILADGTVYPVRFEEEEHGDGAAHRDNNMRAAVVHVLADASVSVMVIVGLILARLFGWLWMDPLAGAVGACVIASWAFALVRDTGAILLDMNPDQQLAEKVRGTIEIEGDRLTDLHLWRLGPGHLAAVLSIATTEVRQPEYYRARLRRFSTLSHITVEVSRV